MDDSVRTTVRSRPYDGTPEGRLPMVAPDLVVQRLSARTGPDAVWIVCTKVRPRCLTVPDRLADAVGDAIALMDGTRSIAEIELALRQSRAIDMAVAPLVARLDAVELTVDAARLPARPQSVLGILPLVTWRTQRLADRLLTAALIVHRVWWTGLGTLALVALGVLAFIDERPVDAFHTLNDAVRLGLLGAACVVSIVLHEIGHVVTAARYGLRTSEATIGMYFGLVPTIYLRVCGIYTIGRRARAHVWAAGCAVNLILATVLLASARIYGVESEIGRMARHLAFWNATMVAVNLLPFLPTDGYFLLSTVLDEYNLRRRSYLAAMALFAGTPRRSDALLRLFALAVALFILRAAYVLILSTHRAMLHQPDLARFAMFAVFAPVLAFTLSRLWQRAAALRQRHLIMGAGS